VNAYTVEIENGGCGQCGAGRYWVIVGPDGVASATSYCGNQEEVEELAEGLNIAYEAGREPVPDLLEALQFARAYIAPGSAPDGPVLQRIDAAIRKATQEPGTPSL
jgi:hypothetical protein